jgi:hypothetical protein
LAGCAAGAIHGIAQTTIPIGNYSFIRSNFYSYATGTEAGQYGSGQVWLGNNPHPWLNAGPGYTGPLPGIDISAGYTTQLHVNVGVGAIVNGALALAGTPVGPGILLGQEIYANGVDTGAEVISGSGLNWTLSASVNAASGSAITTSSLVDPLHAATDTSGSPTAGHGAYGILPLGCSYQPSTASYKRIYCVQTNGAGFYLGGFNYISPSLSDCVHVDVAGTYQVGALITVDEFKTGYGPQAVSNCDTSAGTFVYITSGIAANVVVSNGEVDGIAANGTGTFSDHYTYLQNAQIVAGNVGTLKYSNLALINADQRPLAAGFPSQVDVDYVYNEGMIMGGGGSGSGEHGELLEVGAATINYDHVVVFTPNTTPPGLTAAVYLNNGNNAALTAANVNITNSLIIPNRSVTSYGSIAAGSGTMSAGIEFAYIQYGNINVSKVWIDTTYIGSTPGLGRCVANAGGTASSIVGTLSGGQLTITSMAAGSYVGWLVDNQGQNELLATNGGVNSGTQITGFVSGTPHGVGTYTITGTQSLTLTGGKTTPSPIYGTLTPSGSSSSVFSLETGSQIYYQTLQGHVGCN